MPSLPSGLAPLPCSKSRLSKVGDALVAGCATQEETDLYAAALEAYDQRTTALRALIDEVRWQHVLGRDVEIHVTGRTKTLNTLLDKLERKPEIKLPYIRDLSGVRIVGSFVLSEQDIIARHLQDLLSCPDGCVIDRRSEPEAGYRALHLAAKVDGLPAEIQIRTALQALWADIYERQADLWGREMRYGLPPVAGPDGTNDARVAVVDLLQRASLERIAPLEGLQSDVAEMLAELPRLRDDLAQLRGRRGQDAIKAQTQARAFLSQHPRRLVDLERRVDALVQALRSSLLELGAAAEQVK